MTKMLARRSVDWTGSVRSYGLIWGPPITSLIGGLLLDVPARTVVWVLALAWMGMACLLNARRCGRTHCCYTGPYYLAMIVPVLVLGSGVISAGIYGWVVLGIVIIGGSKLIWWSTEQKWGKFL
jgi:hypothetical protein